MLAVTGAVVGVALGVTLTPSTAEAATPATRGTTVSRPHDLYVYGHSWTTGVGLADKSTRYTHLVAAEGHMSLHSRGVAGSLVNQTVDRLLGPGAAGWHTGATGAVLIQASLNTLRDFGAEPRALATARNAQMTMLATINASRRVEDSSSTHHYSPGWRRTTLRQASGGHVHTTSRKGAYVWFKAYGGEYVVLRGTSRAGATLKVTDRTTGTVIGHVRTGRQVHPSYDQHGIPVVLRISPSRAHHVIRITKESGSGPLVLDARLPQRRALQPVVLVKEPYLADYRLSTVHPHGSDAAVDAFNHVIDAVARAFGNVSVVDPHRSGWDEDTDLQSDGVHPNVAGNRVMADAVERVLGIVPPSTDPPSTDPTPPPTDPTPPPSDPPPSDPPPSDPPPSDPPPPDQPAG